MLQIKSYFIPISIALSLAACSNNTSNGLHPHAQYVSSKTITTIGLEKCKVGHDFFGYKDAAGTFLESLASSTIDWFGATIKKLNEKDISNSIETYNINNLDELGSNDAPKCLTLVRKRGEDIDLVLETAIIVTKGSDQSKTYVSFAPLYLSYSGRTPKSENAETREVSVAYGLVSPEENFGTKEKPTGRMVNFGNVPPNEGKKPYYFAELKKYKDKDKINLNDSQLKSVGTQWIAVNAATSKAPLSLSIHLIESNEPSQISKFLVKAYEDSEEELKAAILANEVFKTDAEIEQKKLEATNTEITNLQNYYNALSEIAVNWESLDKTCHKPEDINAVKAAQRNLDIALRKAKLLADKFGIEHDISVYPVSQDDDGNCPK
ncbi:hypothetical protein I2702_000724 [Vibrio parahaemolyticus]|nr:hypothetical protein [Vibrio parahaemolyticus]